MKILFISDIHFGAFSRTNELVVPGFQAQDDNNGAEPLIEGLINIAKGENINYLLVAGDLTSVSSPLEYYFCEEKLLYIADKIGIPKENIICAVGNHDIDWKVSEIAKKYTDTKDKNHKNILAEQYRLLAANSPTINLRYITKPSNQIAPFSGIVSNDDFILFVLNSGWYCSNDQAFSHGRLGREQYNWFSKELDNYEFDKRPIIVLLHHHPVNYKYPVSTSDISSLEECAEFNDLIGAKGVRLVLHGHRHHPRAETLMSSGWKHEISFVCAGSLSVNASHRSNGEIPNTAHIIDFQKSPEAFLLKNYQYSSSDGWKPIEKNCSVTPLDSELWLGKLYKQDELCRIAKDFIMERIQASKVCRIDYDSLPEELHFISYHELNKLFEDNIPIGYIMSESFPRMVSIIDKEFI